MALALLCAALWPIAAFASGLYARDDLRSWATGVGEAPKLMLASLVLSWPLLGLMTIFGASHAVAGTITATFAATAVAAVARAAARSATHRAPELRQRTLIVGSGDVAERLVHRLRVHPELGLVPIGFLDDEDSRTTGLARLGDLADLPELVALGQVDRVMVAFSRAHHEELLGVLRLCREAGVAVDVVPRLFEFLDGAHAIEHVGGLPLLSIEVPAFSRLSRIAKRALDVVGSAVALVVFSPVLAAVAIAVRLDSRGPVLFTQTRPGMGGRPFRMIKFRSMRADPDPVMIGRDGALAKAAGDTRVTRVGRVLRRFSLDEAPQLLNVLKGDMSLVGPRPILPVEEETLEREWHDRRTDLRPGLTGPWQIAGRSHIPLHDRVALDYQYVSGWSLARDIEILLATVPAVLSGRGAC
ncbi:MAG TPA: sugar transferase [Thermoleophilaceae bacterium]|nr:sugar transferase [Thermoleophilaceae bacterium]